MKTDDQDLVRQFQRGDQAAFETLVRRWDANVLNLAHRMLGDAEDARDVRQLVFVRAFKALENFDGRAQFSTWLYRIGVNLCRDHLRARLAAQKRNEAMAENRRMITETEEHPRSTSDTHGIGAEVARAVSALSDNHREAIVLRHYSGLSFGQIAAILAVPETTVKSRVVAALQTLRDQLRPHFGELAPIRSTRP